MRFVFASHFNLFIFNFNSVTEPSRSINFISMNFNNKVIWITGACSGIGKALALALRQHNCQLILSSRRKNALEAVKQQCKIPRHVAALPFDLADYEQMTPVALEAIKCFGTVDILINNGGISQRSLITIRIFPWIRN